MICNYNPPSYPEIINNIERAMHGFIQVMVATSPYICYITPYNCVFKTKYLAGQMLLMPVHVYCYQQHKRTPSKFFVSKFFVSQWYKKYMLTHTFVYIQTPDFFICKVEVCLCECVFVCVSVHMCMCVLVCMCVCVFMCVARACVYVCPKVTKK